MLSIISVNQREMQAGTFAVAYLKTVALTAAQTLWLPVYFCTYGHLLHTHAGKKYKLKLKGVFRTRGQVVISILVPSFWMHVTVALYL